MAASRTIGSSNVATSPSVEFESFCFPSREWDVFGCFEACLAIGAGLANTGPQAASIAEDKAVKKIDRFRAMIAGVISNFVPSVSSPPFGVGSMPITKQAPHQMA